MLCTTPQESKIYWQNATWMFRLESAWLKKAGQLVLSTLSSTRLTKIKKSVFKLKFSPDVILRHSEACLVNLIAGCHAQTCLPPTGGSDTGIEYDFDPLSVSIYQFSTGLLISEKALNRGGQNPGFG